MVNGHQSIVYLNTMRFHSIGIYVWRCDGLALIIFNLFEFINIRYWSQYVRRTNIIIIVPITIATFPQEFHQMIEIVHQNYVITYLTRKNWIFLQRMTANIINFIDFFSQSCTFSRGKILLFLKATFSHQNSINNLISVVNLLHTSKRILSKVRS